MTRSLSRFKMQQLLSSKNDDTNKDLIRLSDYPNSDLLNRWCSRLKNNNRFNNHQNNHYNSNKFWSFSSNNYCCCCDDDYYYFSSSSINHYNHSHHIHHNKINRCQISQSSTNITKMFSSISSFLLFKDLKNNRMVSTIIILLICIIPIMAQNNDNNWRHRSSSSSSSTNNYKRLRSTPHLLNSPIMNYSSSSSSIITPTLSAGYSVQSKQQSQQQQQQHQRPFRSPSSHSSSSSSIHDSRHHHQQQHHSHAASPYYNSQLLSIPFPSTNQLMYQHPELTHNYFHQISAPGTDGIGPGSSSSSSVIQSNQIPRSINPSLMDRAQNQLMPIKGSQWWDIARHSTNMERISSSLDPNQHMDGRHSNAILPSSSSSSISVGVGINGNGQEILNTINLPLRKKQRKLVRDNPGMLTAISRAMKMAISECQEQFKDRRWNCPVNDWKKGKHVFGKIIQRGCRETAFVYALTSAAVAHSLARACSEGLIETCTCDFRNNRKPSGIDWEWGGCSDNIEFGYKFARQFVDSAERGRDLRFVMNLHNNEAGRLHVSNEMVRECKCHGMSGSCTVKTCWMRLPSFHDVGKNLKDRFDGASRVSMSNEYRGFTRKMMKKVQLKPYENGYKIPTREDLIYFEESPDFCVPNVKYGIMGTEGRTCNATSIGVDGCNLLCCGRGYTTEEKEEYERCNCTFQWCCQVNCKICKIKKKIFRCK